MDQNIFHYLGKRPLKVNTELREQPEAETQQTEAIQLPPIGMTGVGLNKPEDHSDDIPEMIVAPSEPNQEPDPELQTIDASGEWPDVLFEDEEDAPTPPLPTITVDEERSAVTLPWRNNPLLMAIVAGIIAIYLAWNAGDFTDNDIWFILATGRDIFENGIPYTNPFTLHENMGIVVQQWIPCLISYGLYSLGGFVALGLWVSVLTALVVVSLYRLGRLLKADRFGGELVLLVIALAVPALLGYLSMRPHAYTMLILCWLLFFLVKYRRTGKPGWLIGCVALVAIHVNFQMALAPMDLAIIACFAIPDLLAPLHKRGHLLTVQLAEASGKHWPVLLCLLASALALMANPYGIDGALYLINSYGTADYKNFISEMGVLAPWGMGLGGMCAVAMLALAAMAAGKRGLRNIDLPLTLLAFGVGLAAFSHTRNLWLIAFFALPLTLSIMHGWSLDFAKLPHRKPKASKNDTVTAPDPQAIERSSRKRHNIVIGFTIVVSLGAAIATGVLLWQAVPTWQDYEEESKFAPTGLLDYMENEGVDPQRVRLFNPFNIGGYLEWYGYKVFMDPRPELWSPNISGHDTDYYREYVDMLRNDDWTDRDYEEFLDKYDFEYLIVENDSRLDTYLKDFPNDYMSLLGTGEYTLWGKKDAVPRGSNSASANSRLDNGRDAAAQQMS